MSLSVSILPVLWFLCLSRLSLHFLFLFPLGFRPFPGLTFWAFIFFLPIICCSVWKHSEFLLLFFLNCHSVHIFLWGSSIRFHQVNNKKMPRSFLVKQPKVHDVSSSNYYHPDQHQWDNSYTVTHAITESATNLAVRLSENGKLCFRLCCVHFYCSLDGCLCLQMSHMVFLTKIEQEKAETTDRDFCSGVYVFVFPT